MMGSGEVEKAITRAKGIFDNRSQWLPKHERVEIMARAISLMESEKEALVKMAAQEGGKPYKDSVVEVGRSINGVKLAMEALGHFSGKEIPMGQTPTSTGRMAFTLKEPIGLVSSISAFNHPLNLIVHQTIPAVAVGAPVIVKPALTTPLSCIRFVEILKEAGLPEGYCEYVICPNEVAEQLVVDNRVNFFSFIGSARAGWYLRSKLSPGTRCVLEHGGAAPVIVEADADIDALVPDIVKGGFYHSGQVCVSVQRVFVHKNIIQEVVEKMASAVEKLQIGDSLDPSTDCGPLILPHEVNRVQEWVDEAVKEGATLICGGKKLSDTLYAPTILLNPPQTSKVSAMEIFGPVVCVYEYAQRDIAIAQANALPYAFQGAVFTQNIDIALDVAQKMNATAVMINDHTAFRVDWMPFGGRDASGLGMGGIPYTMEDMSRDKLVVFKSKYI